MKNNTAFLPGRLAGAGRLIAILMAAVMILILLIAEIEGVLGGRGLYNYELGCALVNYSAGFVRRGLLGEIIGFMDPVLQPILSVMLLSFASLAFILYIILRRMTRLGVKVPYILAVIFSPSLILMHRGEEFVRIDAFVFVLNLVPACFLLILLSGRNITVFRWLRGRPPLSAMLLTDAVLFLTLTAAALVHEMAAALLPPVLLLFFVYAWRAHRTMHCVMLCIWLLVLYCAMMSSFKFSDSDLIADSWKGVFPNPDSYRYNDGLLSTVDKVRALDLRETTRDFLRDYSAVSFARLLVAAVLPFLVLLLSGIRIFCSSSLRAMAVRCLLLLSCLSPLGLCLAGYDFGRWYSLCALNLVVYTLLIAHRYSGTERAGSSPEYDMKIKNAAVQVILLAAAFVLLNYRINCFGEFSYNGKSLPAYFSQAAEDSRHLVGDIRPFLSRDKVIEPENHFDLPPWRKPK